MAHNSEARYRRRPLAALAGTLVALAGCTAAPPSAQQWPSRAATLVAEAPSVCDSRALAGWCSVICTASCAGGSGADAAANVVDAIAGAGGPCTTSADGLLWYRQTRRAFAPVEARFVHCTSAAARAVADDDPPLPQWAHASGTTAALFVAGSLQDDLSRAGTLEMAALARDAGIPMTWMLGNLEQLRINGDVYDLNHRRFGDDLQVEPYDDLLAATRRAVPWFALTATIDGGGHERTIAHDRALGARGFWGVAWNSNGIDGNADRGTPWGAYCADPASYKRPAAAGCALVGVEWTARDLTRAYLSGHEETYSTDPDDLLERAALTREQAATYVRTLIDAYAAAGEARPLVVFVQQESAGAGADPLGSWTVLDALYKEARRSGMRATTLSDVLQRARTFAGAPRAVAFPFIAGLPQVYDSPLTVAPPAPATIDYSDRTVAMTFLAGRTLPVRVVPFDAATTSAWNRPLPQLAQGEFPVLTRVARGNGTLLLHFYAPVSTRFGVALWADPREMAWHEAAATAAGHAGTVIPFRLPAGDSDIVLHCARCGDATLEAAP